MNDIRDYIATRAITSSNHNSIFNKKPHCTQFVKDLIAYCFLIIIAICFIFIQFNFNKIAKLEKKINLHIESHHQVKSNIPTILPEDISFKSPKIENIQISY